MDLNVVPVAAEAPTLDPDAFVAVVQAVFPEAHVVSAVPPGEFVVPARGQGRLSVRNAGFYYSGSTGDAAMLAVAVRELWPAQWEVVAFDDNWTYQIPVGSDMEATALAEALRNVGEA